MKSLILTILYLAKDTIHRWFTRISSPLARVLVVFFLSLSALSALGSYAISTKLVRDKIMRQGGDIVFSTMTTNPDIPSAFPTEKEISNALQADSYALTLIGTALTDDKKRVTVYTYDFRRASQLRPFMAASGVPTILATEESKFQPGPGNASFGKFKTDIFVRRMSKEHPLMRVLGEAAMVVQPDHLPEGLADRSTTQQVLVRVRNLTGSAEIIKVEQYLRNFIRLEGRQGNIISASRLLGEMDLVLSKQTQCRVAFCIGISAIVGILLTALAGMEYRQNEYIYTLMKSFGIRPTLLIANFIMENIIIVGASFAAALATFMYCQEMIVKQILKLGNYTLTLQEILPEIQLISYTLLGCILLSSFPIAAAANREIGRVLK